MSGRAMSHVVCWIAQTRKLTTGLTPVTIALNPRRKALCAPFAPKTQNPVTPNGFVLRRPRPRRPPGLMSSLVLRVLRILLAAVRLPGALPRCYTAVTLLGRNLDASFLAPCTAAPVYPGRPPDGGDLGAHPGRGFPRGGVEPARAAQRPVRAPRAVGRADARRREERGRAGRRRRPRRPPPGHGHPGQGADRRAVRGDHQRPRHPLHPPERGADRHPRLVRRPRAPLLRAVPYRPRLARHPARVARLGRGGQGAAVPERPSYRPGLGRLPGGQRHQAAGERAAVADPLPPWSARGRRTRRPRPGPPVE